MIKDPGTVMVPGLILPVIVMMTGIFQYSNSPSKTMTALPVSVTFSPV